MFVCFVVVVFIIFFFFQAEDGIRDVAVTGVQTCALPISSTMVNATHNTTWDIYTDTGFESAISNLVGFEVTFTEQGMQDDNYASLEA